jgi:hypothetical protein
MECDSIWSLNNAVVVYMRVVTWGVFKVWIETLSRWQCEETGNLELVFMNNERSCQNILGGNLNWST